MRDRERLKQWRSMKAAAIIPVDQLPLGETMDVVLTFTDNTRQLLKIMPVGEQLALQPQKSNYAFLLTTTQARSLGLVVPPN